MRPHTSLSSATKTVGFTLVIIWNLLSFCGFTYAGEIQSTPDFSGYPPVKGFLFCINLHTNAARNLQQTNFLVITEFYRMDRIGGDMLRYIIKEDGDTLDYIDNGDGTKSDPHRKQLSKEALKQLRAAVDKLPPTNQHPWLHSLVIISHHEGTNWVTHAYARHRSEDDPAEPSAVRELLDTIGEKREAQEVHPF